MTERYEHAVLIIDDEAVVGKAIGHMVKGIGAKYVYMESADMAMDKLKNAAKPFSLIISDYRMPEMRGSEFLEKSKILSPDSVRFLITGYSDIDAIEDAVNKGSIHKYISKPWDNKELKDAIKDGLEQYELGLENKQLLNRAKEQNLKLYKLNKTLKKRTAVYKNKIRKKEHQIEQFRKLLEKGFDTRDFIEDIEVFLKNRQMLDQEKFGLICTVLFDELFEQFQNIATRRGFTMSDPPKRS